MHELNNKKYNPKRLNVYMQKKNAILNDDVKQPKNEINKHQ